MKSISKEKVNIIAPSYKAGIELALLKNIEQANIYLIAAKPELLEYDANNFNQAKKLIFIPNKTDCSIPGENLLILKEEEDYSNPIEHFDSYQAIEIELAKHQYIATENQNASFIFELLRANKKDVAFIQEEQFASSFEGIVWHKVIKLLVFPYTKELLCEIVAIKGEYHEFFDVVFPYVQYSDLFEHEFIKKLEACTLKEDLVGLFELIAEHKPSFIPDNLFHLKSMLKDGVIITKHGDFHNASHKIIHKCLSGFDSIDDCIFIGKTAYMGVKKHIMLHSEYNQHNAWQPEIEKYRLDTAKEKQLAIQGKLGRLKASNLDIQEFEENLYSYIRKAIVNEVRAKLAGEKYDSRWKNYLERSGFEYMKILNKAEKLKSLFLCWIKDMNFVSYEFDSYIKPENSENNYYVEFAGIKDKQIYCAKILWNAPVESEVYKTDIKMLKMVHEISNLASYAIISPEKIIYLDLEKLALQKEVQNDEVLENIDKVKRQYTSEDDLFYWS